MTCEQVYNIWSTDPDLIVILDIRPRLDFQNGHIPGALSIETSEIEHYIHQLIGKLAIVVATSNLDGYLKDKLAVFPEVVLLNQSNRWVELLHPISGQSIDHILKDFNSKIAGDPVTEFIFYQLFEAESSTYTYIIADRESKEAAIIDPVLETVNRDLELLHELDLRLIYILDTHVHADHVTGAGELRSKTKAKTGISSEAGVNCADISLEDGQELRLGSRKIRVIETPGHTNSCLSFYFEGMVFSGDALLIRGTGRTDFQQGSSEKLYDSVKNKLFCLPENTKVYPGHDYKGFTSSTIGLEKVHNPRLGGHRTKEDFIRVMSELKLADPKKIHDAVPANLACGKMKSSKVLYPQIVDEIPVVAVEEVFEKNEKITILDVRRPEEFNNELGHIKGAKLVTLGPQLTRYLQTGDRSDEIVFVCRSGGRSGQATLESIQLGYEMTVNMAGGMISWNEKSLPIEKN